MARPKVKISPPERRSQSNTSQRNSGALKKSKAQENQDTEKCPPNLDYNVIEEIANGVEKMILSWSHLDEGEPEHTKASADENEPPVFALWPGNKERPEEAAETTAGIIAEAVKHSGEMMADESPAEKSATYWYSDASNVSPVENCTSEETSSGGRTDLPFHSLHQKRSRDEPSGKPCPSLGKDVSNAKSTPGTPPISERSVKRMQSQDDGSNKKLQLSVSKKTRWSEKTISAPVNGACCSEEEECVKSPRSDCSLLDLASNCSWNDPLVGSPCRKLTPLSLEDEPQGHEEFGPWASVAGHDPSDIVSRVTARSDGDVEYCAKEKTSFVSFKLWKANKESESGHEAGEASDQGKRSDTNAVAPGSSERVAAQTVDVANPTSESVNVANPIFQSGNNTTQQSNGDLVTGVMEELQIALLECATKYEIKTIEMKMKLKNIKNLTSETHSLDPRSTHSLDPRSTHSLDPRSTHSLDPRSTHSLDPRSTHSLDPRSTHSLDPRSTHSLDPRSTHSDVTSDVIVASANKPTTDQLPEDEMQQVEREKRQMSKMQQVERVKRQVFKLQHKKACLSKELAELKKKERQFDLQKKSLDAALHKLDRLEWEMVKKEQEVEDWQQRQRLAEAQLQDSQMELQRLTNLGDLACLPVDTASLLSLLPTLRGFLQNLAQKDNGGGYSSDDQSQQDDAALCDSTQVDETVRKLLHEIQGLQHELSGMIGSEEPKQFKEITQRQPNVTGRVQSGHKPIKTPSPRLPRDRYPYKKL